MRCRALQLLCASFLKRIVFSRKVAPNNPSAVQIMPRQYIEVKCYFGVIPGGGDGVSWIFVEAADLI